MRIVHHFGIRYSRDADRQLFAGIGIPLKSGPRAPSGNMITSFEISEDDPRWGQASQLAAKFQITESVRTEFDQPEIDSAPAICIFASSQRGYPEPSEKRLFFAKTFDLSDYCPQCGIGARQICPFRIKSVPRLKRSVMQLNWIFDECFVEHDVWTAVFEPLGIGNWPVLLDKTGETIPDLVQLRIDHYADLKLDDATEITCQACGRPKMKLDLRGFCPEPTSIPAPMFKSSQYFGSDRAAFRRVLISPSLYKEISNHSLRGFEFYPCRATCPSHPESARQGLC